MTRHSAAKASDRPRGMGLLGGSAGATSGGATSGGAASGGSELRDLRRLFRDKGATPDLLDAVGSVLVEWMADRLESHIAGILLDQGLQATGRFSPGYCDWEIQDGQKEIFRCLTPETLGVECTSSGMMVPRKSISACMLGAQEVANRYPCVFCARSDCEYRREDAGDSQDCKRSA